MGTDLNRLTKHKRFKVFGKEASKGLREKRKILKKIVFCNVNRKNLPKRKICDIVRKFVVASLWPGLHTDP